MLVLLSRATAGQVASGRDECIKAATATLGPTAEVVKYGRFADAKNLDAVAVIRVRPIRRNRNRLLVSDLVILRSVGRAWKPVLRASKTVTNDAGYIGIDYIDDAFRFYGYEVEFADKRADGKQGFALILTYLTSRLDRDGIPIEIGWNAGVGRYQEFSVNEEPDGFKLELKNPPHRRVHR